MTYETNFRKFWKVISPPIYYYLISILVNYIFYFIHISRLISDFAEKGIIITVNNYLDFAAEVQEGVLKQSLYITAIAAILTLLIYQIKYRNIIYMKDEIRKVNNTYIYVVFLGMTASIALSRFLSLFPIDDILGNYEEIQKTLFGGNLLMEILTLALIVPILEEILFRGLVYGRLRKYSTKNMAAIFSSILFAVYHMNLLQGVYAFILGLLLVFVYERYQSVLAAVILHASANAFSMFLFYTEISSKISSSMIPYIIFMLAEAALAFLIIHKIIKKFPKTN